MCKCRKNRRAKKCCCGCRIFKLLGKIVGIFAALYAILFAVFYFDLDGKFFYYIWEPLMVKRFDKMERRNPLDVPYDTQSGVK